MDSVPSSVEPLEYFSDEASNWAPVVRACAYGAAAHAAIVLITVISHFAAMLAIPQASRLIQDIPSAVRTVLEVLLGAACVTVLVASVRCGRFVRQSDRWMVAATIAMASCLAVREAMRIYWTIGATQFMSGSRQWAVAYVTSTAGDLVAHLVLPLLLIWLMSRPEVRRLF